MRETAPRSRIALVIGSGGVKCAAALGLQQALRDEGIEIDLVVGCSGGAIYAAAAALGWTVDETIEQTLRLWTRDTTSQPRRMALLQAMFPRLFGFSADFSFRDDRLLNARLQQGFGTRTFADTRIPLHITATDFHNGEQVVLSDGLLWEAIRASIAVPFVFSPRRVGGRLLMDGFLSDPLPVNVAVQEQAGVILAIGFESPNLRRFSSPMRIGLQLTSVMSNNLLRSRFAFNNLAHHAEVIPVLPEFKKAVGIFDTNQIPYVIEEGRRAALEHISVHPPPDGGDRRVTHGPEDAPAQVLVADDVEMNRDLLARRVRRLGHEVTMAEDGRQALELLKARDFDVLLLDIMMPNMNGYEVLEAMALDAAPAAGAGDHDFGRGRQGKHRALHRAGRGRLPAQAVRPGDPAGAPGLVARAQAPPRPGTAVPEEPRAGTGNRARDPGAFSSRQPCPSCRATISPPASGPPAWCPAISTTSTRSAAATRSWPWWGTSATRASARRSSWRSSARCSGRSPSSRTAPAGTSGARAASGGGRRGRGPRPSPATCSAR